MLHFGQAGVSFDLSLVLDVGVYACLSVHCMCLLAERVIDGRSHMEKATTTFGVCALSFLSLEGFISRSFLSLLDGEVEHLNLFRAVHAKLVKPKSPFAHDSRVQM